MKFSRTLLFGVLVVSIMAFSINLMVMDEWINQLPWSPHPSTYCYIWPLWFGCVKWIRTWVINFSTALFTFSIGLLSAFKLGKKD
jgi:hypothetical protein